MEMKTVRVRIAVVVNQKGEWESSGWFYGKPVADEDAASLAADELAASDHSGIEATYFIEADLQIPEHQTVQGEVVK